MTQKFPTGNRGKIFRLALKRGCVVLPHMSGAPSQAADIVEDKELKDKIAVFYDQSSPLWEDIWGEHMHMGHYGPAGDEKKTDAQAQIDMVDRLLEWGQVTSPTRVLDVGCGVGGSSRHIARKYPGARVTGVTLSPVQCAHAKERSERAGLSDRTNFEVADALNLPFEDNTFDLLWSMESGEHMPNKEKWLAECQRVLKPGGRMLMATWTHKATEALGADLGTGWSAGGVRIDIANAPGTDDQPRLSLSVSDTGPGISEADQAKLFEHFERGAAERDGAESGAGLGLAMVRRLVEAMDSSMGVESRPGAGARFWVVLELPVLDTLDETPLAGQRFAVASPDATLRATLAAQLGALGGDVVEIARVDQLEAATGRELLLDAVWAGRARRIQCRKIWCLLTPAEKDAVIADLPAGIEGWFVKPVRAASLVEHLAPNARPLDRPEGPVDTEAAHDTVPPLDRPDVSGLTVLVAEDDPVNALIARKCLADLGITVRHEADGDAALAALQAGRFDAALLDQRMPGLDGPHLARAVREAGLDLPLIALTANTTEADRALCLEAGMDEFLAKPLDPDRLALILALLCTDQNRASVG